MGCFSFICKESGKPINSSSFDGDACRLFLLKDGKPIEEMVGHYDSYGRVFSEDGKSFEWKMEWGEVVGLMFDGNDNNGIAAVLENHWIGNIPTTQSEDDPNQGWGRSDDEVREVEIRKPYHIVYEN